MNLGLPMIKSILGRWCSNISPREPIPLKSAVYETHKNVVPNIKFSPLVKKRFLNILLKNESLRTTVVMFTSPLQNILNFLESKTHHNTITSIRQLSRLDNPNIVSSFLFTKLLLLIIVAQKPSILHIIHPLNHMKRQRKVIEHILTNTLIILSHRIQQSFFVTNNKVLNQMILNPNSFRRDLSKTIDFFKNHVSLNHILPHLILNCSVFTPIFVPNLQIVLVHYSTIILVSLCHINRRRMPYLFVLYRVLLKIKVVINLKLSPNKVSLLPSLSKGPPITPL